MWGIYSTAFQGGEAIWSPLTATGIEDFEKVPLYSGDTEAALSQHPRSRDCWRTRHVRIHVPMPYVNNGGTSHVWDGADGRWIDTKALMGAAFNNFRM